MKIKIFAVFLVACSFKVWAQHKPANTKPNIVIILADDMGYGDVSALNKDAKTHTPNIDQLAKQGITFTDAHSGGAVCTPSRYGILTGRYYFRLPKHDEYLGYLQPLIESSRETIGSLMQRAGYETAVVGKWHLGLSWGVKDTGQPQYRRGKGSGYTNTDFKKPIGHGPEALGFNYNFILPASLDMPPYTFVKNNQVVDPDVILTADAYPHKKDDTKRVWDKKYTNADDIYWERGIWWRNGEMSRTFKMENCLDTIVSQGLSFIDRHVKSQPDKPFMLYLPLTGPHTPWLTDAAFKDQTAMGVYGDFVLQIDNVVAQVNNQLKKSGISDNTIIIFASDNGAPWAEDDIQVYNHQSNAGRRGQKGDIYDGGHHIPLIVKWPAKIKKPATYTHTVSLIDMMATFAQLSGQQIAKPYGEDSFSFYEVLMGNVTTPTREDILYESSRGKLAIKKGDWKYIDCLGSGGFTEPSVLETVKGGPTGQLYNLKADPLESKNLFSQNPERVKELKALLDQYVKQGYTISKINR
ncbi:arylsulfatase [Mucilaginibacter panaciglaebae]|uniref:Sulfatase-like hydrolase/transferase n=1 Tax=Mucilaginibacter panaciglaebae TaxID=502331 RepID=A0ABP7WS74_9SPHI